MAGIFCAAATAEIALSAATAKTVLQITAPSNQRLRVRRYSVAFDGVSATAEPVQVRVLRQTSTGTMTSLTPVKLSAGSESVNTTAAHTATAEPTASDVLDAFECHPQSGFDVVLPMDMPLEVPGGTRLGIEVTAPATVNVRAKFWFEE